MKMKKILIAATIACTAIVSNAAATSWKITGGSIKASDLTSAYVGMVEIWAAGGDLSSAVVLDSRSINGGFGSSYTFSTEALTAGETYDVYFVIEDGGKTLTSSVISKAAVSVGTATVGFGNLAAYTSQTSNWVSSSVPEPTSGLLILLGMAGLALRRRRT